MRCGLILYLNHGLEFSLPLRSWTPFLFTSVRQSITRLSGNMAARMKQLQKFVDVDNHLLASCDVKYPPLIGQCALSLLASCIDNALYFHSRSFTYDVSSQAADIGFLSEQNDVGSRSSEKWKSPQRGILLALGSNAGAAHIVCTCLPIH